MEFNIYSKKVQVVGVGDVGVIQIIGSVEQKNLPALENVVKSFFEQNIQKLILDFSEVSSISSSGIGLLINLSQGEALRIINTPNKIKVMFELLGLERRFVLLPNESSAIASWKK